MDIYFKDGKKDFLLDDIVLLYSMVYIPFVFYLKRKDWKWRKVRISKGALSGQLFYP